MDYQLLRNILFFILIAVILAITIYSLFTWNNKKKHLEAVKANDRAIRAQRDDILIKALRNSALSLAVFLIIRMLLNILERWQG